MWKMIKRKQLKQPYEEYEQNKERNTRGGREIRTIWWVKTWRGIHREMEGDRRMSREPEVSRRKDSRGNTAILVGSHEIPCFRWITLPEGENQ